MDYYNQEIINIVINQMYFYAVNNPHETMIMAIKSILIAFFVVGAKVFLQGLFSRSPSVKGEKGGKDKYIPVPFGVKQ